MRHFDRYEARSKTKVLDVATELLNSIHISSSWGLTSSQIDHGLILRNSLLMDGLVVEAAHCWLDIVPLSHLEVLSEVLVSAPPVSMNRTDSLISLHLMEVRVANVVLLAISR